MTFLPAEWWKLETEWTCLCCLCHACYQRLGWDRIDNTADDRRQISSHRVRVRVDHDSVVRHSFRSTFSVVVYSETPVQHPYSSSRCSVQNANWLLPTYTLFPSNSIPWSIDPKRCYRTRTFASSVRILSLCLSRTLRPPYAPSPARVLFTHPTSLELRKNSN